MTRTPGAYMYVPVELGMDYADPHNFFFDTLGTWCLLLPLGS